MPQHPAIAESELLCELLADTLKNSRTEAGLSQNQVAAKGKVSPHMVGYVEKKARRPKIDIFVRIVRGGGRLPSEVMAEAEKKAGWTRGPDGELVFTKVRTTRKPSACSSASSVPKMPVRAASV